MRTEIEGEKDVHGHENAILKLKEEQHSNHKERQEMQESKGK